MAGAVAPLSACIHAAVAALSDTNVRLPSLAWLQFGAARDRIPFDRDRARIAWAVVSVTLIEAFAHGKVPSITRALSWFKGLPEEGPTDGYPTAWVEAESSLAALVGGIDAEPLFPYLLDTFGRTSRLDVMRDGSLKANRAARKDLGSFYTPADVAAFMVSSIAGDQAADATWYDPACGSGVFLSAVLDAAGAVSAGHAELVAFATKFLLGTDISPQACDFAAFVIVQRLAMGGLDVPVDAWIAIRRNVVAADAIELSRVRSKDHPLAQVFGPMERPLRLVCNPPYASAPSGAVLAVDAEAGSGRSLYLPFIEMAWRVARGLEDAAVLVVPLAFGANRTADHRRCRTSLVTAGGDWTMLFFDRQPHALFGEEAKIRTAIIVRRPGPKPAVVRTSNLLKWTSRQRANIFTEDRATALDPPTIGRLVPKLGSTLESRLYGELTRYRLRSAKRPAITKAAPDEIVGASLSNDVFVGGTAYNFLNVFRNYPDRLSWLGTLSASGIHALRCGGSEEADALTAVLASRVAFWLWHVECDGFHVPAWFLQELPLIDIEFEGPAALHLAEIGRAIWEGVQQDILTSLNRDKVTFAFRPTHVGDLRTQVDGIVLARVGFGPDAVSAMAAFEERVVSIDGGSRIARSAAGISTQANRRHPQ